MSYRNEIKCITTKEGFTLIDKLVKKATGVTDEECYLTGKFNRRELFGGKYILLAYEDIKWYDNDPAVEAFRVALVRLDILDIPFMFCRVGDNYKDVEWKENICGVIPPDMPRLRVNIKLEME